MKRIFQMRVLMDLTLGIHYFTFIFVISKILTLGNYIIIK